MMKSGKIFVVLFLYLIIGTGYAQKFIRGSENDPAMGVAPYNCEPATKKLITESDQSIFMSELRLKLKNIKVVDRLHMNLILQELAIGTSNLADPTMSPELGRIIIASFHIFSRYTKDELAETINIRVVYTETGEIVYANKFIYKMGEQEFDPEFLGRQEGINIRQQLFKFAEERALNLYDPDEES